jgi:hypothetical protein
VNSSNSSDILKSYILIFINKTNLLIEKIKNTCPACKTPGFGITGVKEGLPCSACKAPTRSVLSQIYSCQKCNYEELKAYPYDKTEEDPMYCDQCNP